MKVPPAYTPPAIGGQQDIAQEAWWRIFEDDQLDALERAADAANKDIAVALARYDKAAAATRYIRASLVPEVGSTLGAERNREPKYRPNNATTGHAITYNEFGTQLMAGYDLDMWGVVRRTVQMSTSQRQAASADVRFVQLTVEAAVATTYCDVVEADQELNIVVARVKTLEHSRNLIAERLQHGLATTLDLQGANATMDEAKSQLQTVELRRAQHVIGLALLTGEAPEGFRVAPRKSPMLVPAVAIGLPVDLLTRRPDLQASERLLSSASEQIGIAKAAYLPSITLTGVAGYQSTNAAALFNWQSTIESLAASIITPIFTGGRRGVAEEEARADYRAALESYKDAVLHAYGEVEDQLVARDAIRQQITHKSAAVVSEGVVLDLTTQRYRSGLASFLDVNAAELGRSVDQQNLAILSGQEMVATIALVKALGGGWQHPSLP